MGLNPWTGGLSNETLESFADMRLELNDDGSVVYNTQNAKKMYNYQFYSDFDAKNELIDLYADGRDAIGTYNDEKYTIKYNKEEGSYSYKDRKGNWQKAAGLTQQVSKDSKCSNVYLAGNAFTSPRRLFLVLGHELNHVAMYKYGIPQSELVAYGWEWIASIDNHFSKSDIQYYSDKMGKYNYWNTTQRKSYNFGINNIFKY
jgi:hypothetical protein